MNVVSKLSPIYFGFTVSIQYGTTYGQYSYLDLLWKTTLQALEYWTDKYYNAYLGWKIFLYRQLRWTWIIDFL